MATALHNLSDYDFSKVPDASNMCFGIVVAEWNPEITGALAKSEALGKGTAYYHPTPGYDEFLAYCSWRFHEPIPVEDIQSITTIFKRLSDLGLPSSRYFLELRDLGEDSVFTVFAPDYEEWYAHIWDLELLRA